MKAVLLTVSMLFGFSMSAFADNSKCWGIGGDDKRRLEISCTPLTEKLLLSLRGMTLREVIGAMNAPGEPSSDSGLHYIVNTRKYSGFMVLTFAENRVSNISATVQPDDNSPHSLQFIWSASGEMCSDFSDSKTPCKRD